MKVSRYKRLSLNDLIFLGVIFFIPYTSFRMFSLKISEVLTIALVGMELFIGDDKVDSRSPMFRFILCFLSMILLSAFFSLVDPINRYVFGYDHGIYYSFEYGWIFKLFRLFIVYLFAESTSRKIKDPKDIDKIFDVYIISCILLDVYGMTISFDLRGIGRFGIVRNALAAVEPSEAGFINCAALLAALCLFLKKKTFMKAIQIVLLSTGQLFIGSTASLIAFSLAFIFFATVYIFKVEKRILRRTCFIVILVSIFSIGVIYLIKNTNIFDKIINYQKYIVIEGSSVAERLATILTSLEIFQKRKILGVGFGNFGWYLHSFVRSEHLRYIPGGDFQPNNMYAQLLAELGLAGILIYGVFLIRSYRSMICVVNKSKDLYWYGIILLSWLTYILAHNMTLPTIYSFQFWMMCGMIKKLQMEWNREKARCRSIV